MVLAWDHGRLDRSDGSAAIIVVEVNGARKGFANRAMSRV